MAGERGTNYLTSGQVPERRGNAHPNIVPYDAFACRDGHVLLAVGNDAQFARFCDAVGLEGLNDDPRFDTNQHRIEHRAALMPLLAPALEALNRDEIIRRLHAVKVPVGPIHNVAEALASDQAQARGAVVAVPCDGVAEGHVRLLGNPLKLSATPVTYRHAPPICGQDTDAVLQMLRQAPDTAG